jgi:ankyrin repeat protein
MRKAAELLIQAAQMGHPLARASFRTVLAALGHPSDDISQDTESGWLSDLVKTGEGQQSLAKRRLCQLDPTKYVPAIRERWRLYCEGTPSYAAMMDRFKDIFSATSESDLILSFAWEKIEPGTADFLMFAHFNLLRKHWSILKQVLPSLGADINAAVFQDRTLLMEACYAGDAKAAIILIDAGADVTSAAQSDGVTPLHLLSRFPDDKISNVAAKLKDAGADIEARCHLPRQPPGRTDLLDATVRATPLLSAVVAQSIPAVRALLCLGADPFDEAAMVPEGYAPAPFREGDRCYGPVHYAARLHLFDILRELLPEDQRYEQLNTSVRYEEPSLEVRPIWCALDYSNIGLWERLCLHGDGHIMRCKQTVLFLYKRGARNSKTFVHLQDQYHRRSFAASCHCGQPFLMQLLWNIPDGQLRPESIDLARIFQTAIDFDDLPVVEHLYPLLEQSVLKTAGTEQFTFKASVQGYKPAAVIDYMIKLQQRLAANPDGRIQIQLIRDRKETVIIGEDAGPVAVPRYQGGIRVSLSIRPGLAGLADWSVGSVTSARPDGDLLPPPAPGPPTLESTILGGYFDLARELYEPGKSDLICRRADGVGSSTLLGRLIKESKKSPAAERQVDCVLSLDSSASDDLFWNVVEDDDGGLQYTALHLAVTLPDESWGIRQPRVARPVLMSILRKWASAEHLNQLTSTGPDGRSALHIAVETGNLEGLELLANEVSEGLDWDIQNGLGETPLDLALWRAHNAAQIVRESGIVSREDPRWSSKTREVCETSLKMKDLLREEGAHHRKIGGMVIREGNDNWTIKKLCDLPTPMLSQVEEDMRFCKDNGLFGNEERGAGEAPQGEEEQLRFQAAMEELRKRSPFWLEMPVGGIVLLPTTVPETA